MKKAYLVLKNGRVFEGQTIGAEGIALGEMVFTTGVTGYIENLTDPCYAGQIVMQTFPLIGNYGVAPEDLAGNCCCAGFVVREMCDEPSNFRSEYELDRLLKDNGIVGICGVDTREITGILRDEGVMNAMICTELPADMEKIGASTVPGVDAGLVVKENTVVCTAEAPIYNVAVIDCGAGMKLAQKLADFGCRVTIVPQKNASEIAFSEYEGVAVSEGPGDPVEYSGCVDVIRRIIGNAPVFGVGLGHQIAALALGGNTYKLKYGHRGGNQPVKFIENGRVYITTQNHGYAAEAPEGVDGIFVNINDGSCEGMCSAEKKLLTVQFMPDCCAGPNDMSFVYARFMEMMGGKMDAKG